jgi:hypothetical protein
MSAFIDEHRSERVVEAERLLELVRATTRPNSVRSCARRARLVASLVTRELWQFEEASGVRQRPALQDRRRFD